MKSLFLIVSSLLTLIACKEVTKPKKERSVQIDTMILVAPPASSPTKVSSNATSILYQDTTTYIRFGDCYLSLNWIQADNKRNDLELRPDTLYFLLRAKHSIEGQMLTITSPNAKNVEASQRYETSVSVNGTLFTGYKHYQSDWEKLSPEAPNFYICKSYSPEQRKRFPNMDLPAFKQYVKNSSSPFVYEKVATLKQFPAKVDISRYYLRLEGLSNTKLLIFDVTAD